MLVEELKVYDSIASPASLGETMIDLHSISIHKEQTAGQALPLLCLQESSDSRRDFRMVS